MTLFFDSAETNPILDAENIIINYKVSNHALRKLKDVDYYRGQMLVVLRERLINDTTYKKVGEMLNVWPERIRQIEAKIIAILKKHMKGIYG